MVYPLSRSGAGDAGSTGAGGRLRHRSVRGGHRAVPVQAGGRGAGALSGRRTHAALDCTQRGDADGAVGRAPRHAGHPDPSGRRGVLVSRGVRGYTSRARLVRHRRKPLGGLSARVRGTGERRPSATARPDRPAVDVAGDGRGTPSHRDHPLAAVLRRHSEAGPVQAGQRGPSKRPPRGAGHCHRAVRCDRTAVQGLGDRGGADESGRGRAVREPAVAGAYR